MAVYVGPSLYRFGRMIMCHMSANSLTELHRMANLIGIERRHFQGERLPHYDICKSKRTLALSYGAIETDERTILRLCQGLRALADAKESAA